MKITMVMVSSIDGKTTKWGNSSIYNWTSPEDQTYFSSVIQKNNLIIMGRKTYQAAKNIINLKSKKLRIILTKTPQKYIDEQIPNQLEFTNLKSHQLVEQLENRGYKQALLIGGEEINSLFLKTNLVSNLWLTIEPLVFGQGHTLVGKNKLNLSFKLESVKKINNLGTLLLKYKILP